MQSDNRSRRHFLAGCLAALAAWFVPWRKAVPAAVPQPVILAAGPAPGCQTVTQYSYDAADRLLGVEHLPRGGNRGETGDGDLESRFLASNSPLTPPIFKCPELLE